MRSEFLWGSCDALFTPRPLGPLLDIALLTGGCARGARHERCKASRGRDRSSRGSSSAGRSRSSCSMICTGPTRRLSTFSGFSRAGSRACRRSSSRRSGTTSWIGSIRSGSCSESSRRRRRSTAIELAPLSEEGVAALAEPHGVDPEELHRMTAGNPFFVTEALAADEQEIPPTVRDAVLARLARLSPGARTLLEAVAVVSVARGALAARRARRRRSRGHRGVRGSGRGRFRRGRSRLPSRARAARRRGVADTAPPHGVAPSGARRRSRLLRTGSSDLARLAHHAEAAGDARGGRPVRAGRSAACGGAWRASRGGRPVRDARCGTQAVCHSRSRRSYSSDSAYECYVTSRFDAALEAQQRRLRAPAAARRAARRGRVAAPALATPALHRPYGRGDGERETRQSRCSSRSAPRPRARDGVRQPLPYRGNGRRRRRDDSLGRPRARART